MDGRSSAPSLFGSMLCAETLATFSTWIGELAMGMGDEEIICERKEVRETSGKSQHKSTAGKQQRKSKPRFSCSQITSKSTHPLASRGTQEPARAPWKRRRARTHKKGSPSCLDDHKYASARSTLTNLQIRDHAILLWEILPERIRGPAHVPILCVHVCVSRTQPKDILPCRWLTGLSPRRRCSGRRFPHEVMCVWCCFV